MNKKKEANLFVQIVRAFFSAWEWDGPTGCQGPTDCQGITGRPFKKEK